MTSSTTLDLLARDQAHLFHPLHDAAAHRSGHVWVRGEGARLSDAEGKEFIDGLSGLWNVSRSRAEGARGSRLRADADARLLLRGIREAPRSRYRARGAVCAGSVIPPSTDFFSPRAGANRATPLQVGPLLLAEDGKPEKTKVISRQLGYHGVTLAAMSATGLPAYWPMFEPRVPGFLQIPALPVSSGPAGFRGARADELEEAIRGWRRHGRDVPRRAGQGRGRRHRAADDYFPRIREICDRHDVLLRRSHHRLRSNRQVVRPRTLGNRTGHDLVRERDNVRLLPAGGNRGLRRDCEDHRRGRPGLDARLHLQL